VQTLQRAAPSSEPHRRGYYEAEDAAFPDASARHRSGQYYSPPGTSYTIVEARSSARDLPLREIGFRFVQNFNIYLVGNKKGKFFCNIVNKYFNFTNKFLWLYFYYS